MYGTSTGSREGFHALSETMSAVLSMYPTTTPSSLLPHSLSWPPHLTCCGPCILFGHPDGGIAATLDSVDDHGYAATLALNE